MFRRSVIFFLLSVATVHAQVVGGTISGTVSDGDGAVIPGATVVIRNQETGGERHLVSDSSGIYAAPSIPVGVYTVSVARDGFAPQIRTGILLTVGQATRIDVSLRPGALAEQVTVTDAPASVNVST
jgi:Carboxypeptidase regulatory-like domain